MVLSKKANITLNSLGLFSVYIGIFLIPFNSYEGPGFLGEYNRHPCTYFFLLAFFISSLDILLKKRIYFPYKNIVFQILLILLTWAVIATVLNLHNIIDYYFKGTTGIVRFIKQYASLVASALLFLFTYVNLFHTIEIRTVFKSIRKIYLLSLIIVTIYAFFEILIVFFNISAFLPLLELFNYFPFTTVKISTLTPRISSVSFEPPELATYLITIAGWMFSYILTSNGIKKYIPAMVVIVLTFFSDSRSGLAIVLIQFILFIFLLYRKKVFRYQLNKMLALALIPLAVLFFYKGGSITQYVFEKMTSFSLSDSTHGGSNKSRLGIQYANMKVFSENPISGVGFGQSAFVSKKHYPSWATDGNWEFTEMYLNPYHKPFPSVYNMYVRMLSETGIIGFLLFILFIGALIWVCYRLYVSPNFYDNEFKIFMLVLFITFVGISGNWLKTETFRIFGFWVAFAFFLLITGNKLRFFSKSRKIK